jgi:hypothetical protein
MSTPLPMAAADPRTLRYKDAVVSQLHVWTAVRPETRILYSLRSDRTAVLTVRER